MIIFVYAVLRSIVFHITYFNIEFLEIYSSLEFFVLGTFATYMIYNTRLSFDKGTINYRTVSYFGAGFIIWAIGNFVWVIQYIVFEQTTGPAFSDPFFIGGYIPIIYILIVRSRSVLVPPEKKRFIVVSFIFVLFTFISVFYVIIPILLSEDQFLLRLVTVIYPLLDIMLMGSSLSLFPKYAGGKLEMVWLLISLCIMMNAIANLMFSYQYRSETYNTKSWANDLVIFTYLLVLVFAYYMKDLFRKVK